MRDYAVETKRRIAWIRAQLSAARADGIVFGNSGGKDSALVGILCKLACENTVGIAMPISKRNFGEDLVDADEVADKFAIEKRTVELADVRDALVAALGGTALDGLALANISPRLRMTTLYAVAAAENRLVAGTGNRSETHMGYFTKWGDGGCDFNPIADLTVTEVYEFLRHLDAPGSVIEKAPSAALFDGQTDEQEMGITYAAIDDYLLNGVATAEDKAKIDAYYARSEHKRRMPSKYSD